MAAVLTDGFKGFVILAAMRTGSNFLEESLNQAPGLRCHGEAFNPVFLAHPGQAELFGLTMADRDRSPGRLLRRIAGAPGLNGFRFFPDHDRRILGPVLDDPAWAKIVLGRNPLESYVSLKIARETGQWRLAGPGRRQALVRFDADEFRNHLDEQRLFRAEVFGRLRESGQTAFHLDYDDLGNAAVLHGLLGFLGVSAPDLGPARRTMPQNPEPLLAKVENPDEMRVALAGLDPFGLGNEAIFEPARGPGVPGYVAAAGAPVLYMPIPGVADDETRAWLGRLGSAGAGTLGGFNQATLRDWMVANAPFQSFSLLDHPLRRAWAAFAGLFAAAEPPELARLVAARARIEGLADGGFDRAGGDERQQAFHRFLGFLRANLAGQTGIRTPQAWSSQSMVLQGFARLAGPMRVLRPAERAAGLGQIAVAAGVDAEVLPDPPRPLPDWARGAEADALVRQAYARDFALLGFSDYCPEGES